MLSYVLFRSTDSAVDMGGDFNGSSNSTTLPNSQHTDEVLSCAGGMFNNAKSAGSEKDSAGHPKEAAATHQKAVDGAVDGRKPTLGRPIG